jgi:diguanylate cyclase (GGDEF)-like protein
LALIDYFTGFEISFSFFYLIPVAMIAWFTDKKFALLTAIVSAITWQLVNQGAGEQLSNQLIPIWNTLTRLGFFVVVAMLLLKLKTLLNHESNLARTDYLTGAANPRFFYEVTQTEIDRTKRYKRNLTICYFDADNFKKINDTLGHHVGSELLIKVVQVIKNNLRSTDLIGRLGGDEFAILLPETNQEQSRIVISKIRKKLQAEMDKENWNVTFSMGVLTCAAIPKTVDEIIKIADSLMYEVKKKGKNSVKFQELNEETPSLPE